MTFQQEIIAAIKDYCDANGGLEKAAEKLGISKNTLQSWYYSKKIPSVEKLSPFAEKLGIFLQKKLPSTPVICRLAPYASAEFVEGEGLQEISIYNMAGAGPAVDISEIEPLFSIFAPPAYLRQASFAMLVNGHSMEPLIPNQAVVGIDSDARFTANELYAAHIPYEGMVIKRVGVDVAAGEFIFKSENSNKEAYPDFRLNIADAEKIIVGRVVWVMWGY